MKRETPRAQAIWPWMREKLFLGMTFPEYVRSLLTPFNAVALLIVCIGLVVTWIRFTQGLAPTTNLNDDYPWGLWIGFDVLCGVALAAGGFCIAFTVHILGVERYRSVVRPAILTGFLGYFFVVVGLCFDLGRPWRLPYPMFYSFGVTSAMFEVAWCVALYLTVLFLEFCPTVFEWLGLSKFRQWALKLTLGLSVLAILLSTLHQSALGTLFLIMPGKVHPLWYSAFIPVFFFISSIAAGLSMIIFESALSHRIFGRQVSDEDHENFDRITVGLGKGAAIVLFTYFCLRWLGVAHENRWDLLMTGYGQWFFLEIVGFVLAPCFLYVAGVRWNSARIVRVAAVWTILGIVLNRLNVSIFTFNWRLAERYIPHWMEFMVTLFIVTVGLLAFRAIVNRMPVLYVDPKYPVEG